jgi:glycosyltransferase involved in cell wall biosynthesis
MKIIIAGPAWPYRGGIAEFSNRLAREFAGEGHDVSIFTFTLQYPAILFPGKSQLTDAPAPSDLKIARTINSVNPFNWISTGWKLRKERADILLLRYWLPFMAPCFGTIARIVKGNRHTRIITIFDNVVPHEKRPGDRLLTKYFVSGIDGAIVMSKTVLSDLKKFNSSIPVKFNPHPLYDNYGEKKGREEAIEKLRLSPDFRYILFFGFIRAYKGLDLLLDAFGDERLRKFNLKLAVAGEFYEDDSRYRQIVAGKKLEGDVIFFNRFIPDEEVPLFFGVSDLVVQPYKSATQSGVTQIAYHYEKPMVVTDVGGLKEIVPDGKCGYVVKPDPAEIADAIADFFGNYRYNDFVLGKRDEKKKFTWDRMTSAINDLYKSINRKDR